LTQYPHEIKWGFASSNPCLLPLLEKYTEHIHWGVLCSELYPEAIPLVEKHMNELDGYCWYLLSSLPTALPLLEKYPERIQWSQLCRNPSAIHLLTQHPEKIQMHDLSANPNATHLLFRLDYLRMKETHPFREELIETVLNPDRLMRLSSQYGMDMRTYLHLS
jgi:hypothetical protein